MARQADQWLAPVFMNGWQDWPLTFDKASGEVRTNRGLVFTLPPQYRAKPLLRDVVIASFVAEYAIELRNDAD